MNQLNMDVATELPTDRAELARCLHRVVRAMHDGHCPKCGHLDDASMFRWPGRHECPSCGFTVSKEEAEAALQEFRPYLQKSLEVFEIWRGLRPIQGE